ncbi:MAG: hypothetical protein Q9208_004546 [Pyrenodesmia sp. 3 TL-2023]
MDKVRLKDWVAETINELQTTAQISLDSMGMYQATPLSRATVGACMTPEDGVFVHDELRRALQAFVMDGEMHVFYMFTPVNISNIGDINWRIFRTEIEKLDESGLRVLEFVGINPAFVNRMFVHVGPWYENIDWLIPDRANSGKQFAEEDPEQVKLARVYRRFYAAFQLRDLCNEVPIHLVARKFEIARGFVQTLAQTCEGFAAGMIQFCEILGWGMLKSVLQHMSDRLKAGARADLLELAQIPFVKSRTARIFWENGMRSLRAVAEADAKELVPLLLLAQAQPKRYNVAKSEDERYQQKILLRAEIIVESANRLVQETLPEEVLQKMYAPPKDSSIPTITPAKLQEYDAVLFGVPTRYGNFPAQMKAFFDSTGSQWQQGSFWGKYAGLFVSTAGLGGGQESTCIAAMSTLVHHGMIFVPLGYKTTFAQLTNLNEVHGGSPWGAGTFAGTDGSRQPTPLEIEIATAQGKAFFETVNKAHGGH